MAVHENVYPGAQKEKYVIRRLLRRAVLDGHQLGLHDAFLHKLVPAVVEQMKDAYPDVAETTERVASVIRQEEESFFGTIDAGLDRITNIFDRMKSDNHAAVDGREAARAVPARPNPAQGSTTIGRGFDGLIADVRFFAID